MSDWRELLRASFDAKTELCHGGCGDKAEKLRLTVKYVGAFCYECYAELHHGRIPKLDGGRP